MCPCMNTTSIALQNLKELSQISFNQRNSQITQFTFTSKSKVNTTQLCVLVWIPQASPYRTLMPNTCPPWMIQWATKSKVIWKNNQLKSKVVWKNNHTNYVVKKTGSINDIFTHTHRSIHTCWCTSAIDKVKCRNTFVVAKTTAPFACCSLSSRRFIISNISLLSDGMYLATNSITRHCAHSLNSLMLHVANKRNR